MHACIDINFVLLVRLARKNVEMSDDRLAKTPSMTGADTNDRPSCVTLCDVQTDAQSTA